MSQQDCLNFLKENKGKWFTSKEMADGMGVPYNRIPTNLLRLRKTDYIIFNIEHRAYKYKYNEGCKRLESKL